jgi:arylamine N-acetyltransferase
MDGRRHVVNIVTLGDGLKYMVDVGFGGDGPIQPLPVLDGHVVQNIGTQELRLVHSHIPPQTLLGERNKMWIYQYRNGPEREWNSFYAFPELEFFSPDFEIINYFISHSPESFQTYRLLVVKFLRAHSKDSDSYIHGKVMLVNDQVKLNTGGRTSVVQTCRTEAERVKALEKHFGITLKDKERRGIEGRSTELGKQADFDAST